MKIKTKKFINSFLLITIVFTLIYYSIYNPTLNGLIETSIFSNYIFITIVILLSTIKLSIHLIRIKIIFWKVFLQTFLNTSSKIYIFLSHGYLLRIIAVILSIGLSIKILIFFCLTPVHLSQFLILYFGIILFSLFKINDLYGKNISFIRYDLGLILKIYLTAFLLATFTGVCVSVWEIYNIENIKILELPEIMNLTADIIDPNNDTFLWLIRFTMRHIYAYELLIQNLVSIEYLGKPLYFLYLVISEGSVTFFGVYLLALPVNLFKKDKDENN